MKTFQVTTKDGAAVTLTKDGSSAEARCTCQEGQKGEICDHVGYNNGFRLDQALASPSFDRQIAGVSYSHQEREAGMSDHSVMLVDVARGGRNLDGEP